MTIDPHAAERMILIGCHEAAARKHAMRLFLLPEERSHWLQQTLTFLNDTVKYDSTSTAVFVAPQFRDWAETAAIIGLTRAHYQQARINQNTVEAIGEQQGRNFVCNLRLAASGALRDARPALPCMEGRTAIVCGAGPSFELTADAVAKHKGPIIAVNTSAGACAQRGIRPDAVVCTESKPVREGIARMSTSSHMVMDLIGNPANWRDPDASYYPNLCIVGTEPNLAPYARMLDMLPLAYGSSCTTAAVSLALACGAARVVLVGQDCAFMPYAPGQSSEAGQYEDMIDARMYASGTPYEETKVLIRQSAMQARILKPTVGDFMQDVIVMEGVHGEPVWTTHSMASFAAWFRDQPPEVRTRVVNASAHGVRIDGIEHMPIGEVIDQGERYGAGKAPEDRGEWSAREFVERAVKTLRHVDNVASTGLKVRDPAAILNWARKHSLLNMWVSPERLRMRRLDLPPAERGYRVAAVIKLACDEIVKCARGEELDGKPLGLEAGG